MNEDLHLPKSEFMSVGEDILCDSRHICCSKEEPHWPAQTSANSPHWITRTSAQQLDSRQQQTAASQLYGHNSYFITFVFLSKFPRSNAQ